MPSGNHIVYLQLGNPLHPMEISMNFLGKLKDGCHGNVPMKKPLDSFFFLITIILDLH